MVDMFGLPVPVFVVLLAVRLLARDVWLAEASCGANSGRRDALWSSPLVAAYWGAERARWAEEEARQDAGRPTRTSLAPDEVRAVAPPMAPRRHPDVEPEIESRLLAWGAPDAPATGPKRSLRKFALRRLGPRPEDVYGAAAGDDGQPSGPIWGFTGNPRRE